MSNILPELKNVELSSSETQLLEGIDTNLPKSKIRSLLRSKVLVSLNDGLSKTVLIGHSPSGKSSLLSRFAYGTFVEEHNYTIGVEFGSKVVEVEEGSKRKLQIWDTAGQERFRSVTVSYYRGASVIFILFDITSHASFEPLTTWMADAIKYSKEDTVKLLVGTKLDKQEERLVSMDEIEEFCNKHGCKYIEVSNKTGENVEELFGYAARLCTDKSMKESFPNYYSFCKTAEDYYEEYLDLGNGNKGFMDIFESKLLADGKIKDIPVHKFLLEKRIERGFEDIKLILEKETLENIENFLVWVYGGKYRRFKIQVAEICKKFGIDNVEERELQYTLDNLYKDEESKDYSIIAVNKEEGEEEEEEEEEEIPVHKFVLLARSGLFRELFKNIDEKSKRVKDYSGKAIESLEVLIKYFYTGVIELTADHDPELIKEDLKDASEYYQLSKNSKFDELLQEIN
ncbi:small rab-related gtpase [Anaeramoeba flamelloides]|uniref:Small rab-related gtpase n=1 Tax=Anaeramoeba flamelloides TaxID=1746091 RepID=A0ABQ8YFZ0_9EUKA|nr:small rab-related gtpase [Anaeramoeba flamelloides]